MTRKWEAGVYPRGRDHLPRAATLLSVDFDVWHPGDSEDNCHCGRCKEKRHLARSMEVMRPVDRLTPTFGVDRYVPTKSAVLDLISLGTQVYAAESHAEIIRVVKGPLARYGVTVIDLDHHKDTYFSSAWPAHCANWISVGLDYGYIMRYARLMEVGAPQVDAVFTCKSSPYLMPDADRLWLDWLTALEARTKKPILFVGWMAKERELEFRGMLYRPKAS